MLVQHLTPIKSSRQREGAGECRVLSRRVCEEYFEAVIASIELKAQLLTVARTVLHKGLIVVVYWCCGNACSRSLQHRSQPCVQPTAACRESKAPIVGDRPLQQHAAIDQV